MKLLCFAHRNEAKTFFDRLKLSPLDTSLNLFKSDQSFIVITGEGIQNTTEALSIIVSKYEQITEIINYGVCAGLENSLKKNELFSIRTVYQYFDDFSFKSHTSSDEQADLDLISVHKRMYSPDDKLKLSIYAQVLDMETWAIASVAKRFKIPWRSFKTISDEIDENTDCQQIIKDVDIYSDLFWNHFNSLESSIVKKSNITSPLLENSQLHFTHTQSHLVKKYLNSLKLRDVDFSKNFFHSKQYLSILESDYSKKEKAKKIITLLESKYDPITSKEKTKTKEIFNSLKNKYLSFDHSDFIERSSIKFKGQFSNEVDLKNIIATLESIDLQKLKGESKDV